MVNLTGLIAQMRFGLSLEREAMLYILFASVAPTGRARSVQGVSLWFNSSLLHRQAQCPTPISASAPYTASE